ncbi:MAG: acyl carrier protein [Bacteroidia bacterium]
MDNTQKLRTVFSESFGIDTAAIPDDLAYQSIKEWDSISHMVLISNLEDSFDISIDTDDVIDMSSFMKAKEILIKYKVVF